MSNKVINFPGQENAPKPEIQRRLESILSEDDHPQVMLIVSDDDMTDISMYGWGDFAVFVHLLLGAAEGIFSQIEDEDGEE